MTKGKCDTIFYQGMNNSQVQALKYVGSQKIRATTGEIMWCTGKNNLPPLNVIYNLHIGEEIADVNLQPFHSYVNFFNPITVMGVFISSVSNWLNGFHFLQGENQSSASVMYHAPVLSNISIGQESDIESHKKKYQSWLRKKDKSDGLILYGVSRGTAATFCALSQQKYPEVKLVILEGAIDSVSNILGQRPLARFPSLFTQHMPDGVSPLKCLADYPECVPTVFITSEIDSEVPCKNTENIAQALASRGKNDVYLLKLKRSSHPNYMFDDEEDRNNYESMIHAVYRKYNLEHDPMLAEQGQVLLSQSTLFESEEITKSYRPG